MAIWFAFLRAVNVGGRTVRMEQLKSGATVAGVQDVETFIASGNLIFRTNRRAAAAVERAIEEALERELGFEVGTYVRTDRQLAAIVALDPFGPAFAEGRDSWYVGFLHEAPSAATRATLEGLSNDTDQLVVEDREVHLLVHGKLTDSTIAGPAMNKALGAPTTMRNITTLRRLAAKYLDGGR